MAVLFDRCGLISIFPLADLSTMKRQVRIHIIAPWNGSRRRSGRLRLCHNAPRPAAASHHCGDILLRYRQSLRGLTAGDNRTPCAVGTWIKA